MALFPMFWKGGEGGEGGGRGEGGRGGGGGEYYQEVGLFDL